jgi:hypothetical protein
MIISQNVEAEGCLQQSFYQRAASLAERAAKFSNRLPPAECRRILKVCRVSRVKAFKSRFIGITGGTVECLLCFILFLQGGAFIFVIYGKDRYI